MNNELLKQMLTNLSRLPIASVDRNFLQGKEVVSEQLNSRSLSTVATSLLDKSIENLQNDLVHVEECIKPHHLPNDYKFFLAYSGGMLIEAPSYRLVVAGIGPMVEEWYGFLLGDSAIIEPGQEGFLNIASLIFSQQQKGYYPEVQLMLDLDGHIQQECIVALEPRKNDLPNTITILANPATYAGYWKILAPNFTVWLQRILETDGLLGYNSLILS